ncbi:hypothetical protein FOCC_FOCC016685 [Frankliniella occidentalis]|nr:hypothetical protein FOCC_FOCC016685 [Frankliniella occidentalis]
MSANNLIRFVRNFGVMMGHLVPIGSQVWYFYLLVRKMMDIVFGPVVTESLCITLESLIEEHHHLYFVLFNDTLKPKHHNMVHYSIIMCEVGPFIHKWSMRFESKNQAAAVAPHATKSRLNICKTLAIREQITQVSNQ